VALRVRPGPGNIYLGENPSTTPGRSTTRIRTRVGGLHDGSTHHCATSALAYLWLISAMKRHGTKFLILMKYYSNWTRVDPLLTCKATYLAMARTRTACVAWLQSCNFFFLEYARAMYIFVLRKLESILQEFGLRPEAQGYWTLWTENYSPDPKLSKALAPALAHCSASINIFRTRPWSA
jgi:hypothetical protein